MLGPLQRESTRIYELRLGPTRGDNLKVKKHKINFFEAFRAFLSQLVAKTTAYSAIKRKYFFFCGQWIPPFSNTKNIIILGLMHKLHLLNQVPLKPLTNKSFIIFDIIRSQNVF